MIEIISILKGRMFYLHKFACRKRVTQIIINSKVDLENSGRNITAFR